MHHFIDSGMLWKLFNFVVFVGLLVYLLRKPLEQFWRCRRMQLMSQMESAKSQAMAAEKKHKSYEERLARIQEETEKLIREFREEGDLEKEKILQETEAWRKRAEEEIKKIAEQEVKKAASALQKEATLLATTLAEKLIRDKINGEDQIRLMEQSLKQMEEYSS
ncbi:MAG: ATP synthase F0 subunit B [bacterium]|nr:ATP synthase F0 subunit B [bacterium]